ncbi:MAG: tetratricopeptide repeat protein [Nitrospirota bacterium]
MVYFKAGKHNDAIIMLGQALHLDPNHALARQVLGEVYLLQRELKKAEMEFLKNILNNPDFAKTYYFLGKLYMDELLDYERATEYLAKYKLLDLNNSFGYLDDTNKRLKKLKELFKQDYNREETPKGKARELLY